MMKCNHSVRCWLLMCLAVLVISYGTVSAFSREQAAEVFTDAEVIALATAASQGKTKLIDTLVAQGVDVNARGEDGITPLVFVLSQKNIEGFTRLLHHGADPNLIYNGRDSVMWDVVAQDDVRYLKLALDYGGDVNALSGNRSVIFDAITLAKVEAVKVLIDAGAELNFQNRVTGETPLHRTGNARQYQIAYLLLEAGADPRVNDKRGKHGLLWAIEKNPRPGGDDIYAWRQKVIEFLRDTGMEVTPLEP